MSHYTDNGLNLRLQTTPIKCFFFVSVAMAMVSLPSNRKHKTLFIYLSNHPSIHSFIYSSLVHYIQTTVSSFSSLIPPSLLLKQLGKVVLTLAITLESNQRFLPHAEIELNSSMRNEQQFKRGLLRSILDYVYRSFWEWGVRRVMAAQWLDAWEEYR